MADSWPVQVRLDEEHQLTSLRIHPHGMLHSGALGTMQLPCGRLTRLQELACVDVSLPSAAPLALVPDADSAAGPAAAPNSDSADITTGLRRPLLPALQRLRPGLQQGTLDSAAGLVQLAPGDGRPSSPTWCGTTSVSRAQAGQCQQAAALQQTAPPAHSAKACAHCWSSCQGCVLWTSSMTCCS